MANIYTEPVQSQFVPTYAPVNLDAINMGAQAMQRRQEENFMKADNLQQKAMEMRKNILSQDEGVFEEKIGAIRKNLDELAADGDLSDAGRQIRSLAKQFQEEAMAGDVGKAMENFQKVQSKYEAIDDADLTGRQKDALKQLTIEGYQGVGKGGLDLSSPTDDIDLNKFVKDQVGDISPQKLVQDTDWSYNSTIGKFEKGRIKTSQVPPEIIRNVIQQGFAQSPEALDAIRQRAKISTVGQDEFVRTNEDGEIETISKDDKIQQLVNAQIDNAVSIGMQKYAENNQEITTQVTSAGAGATSGAMGNDITIDRTGITIAKEVGLEDIGGALEKINEKIASDKPEEAAKLEGSLDLALHSFEEEDEDITEDDIRFLKAYGQHYASGLEDYANRADPGKAFRMVGQKENAPEDISEEQKARVQALGSKFNDWIEKGGGWTDIELGFDVSSKAGDQAHDRAQDAIQASNPNNWKLYGVDDADSQEYLMSNRADAEGSVFDTFKFVSVVPGNDHAPTMVNGIIEDPDGETQRVRLEYKRDPSLPAESLDPVDGILRQMGERGQRAMEQRRTEHIRALPSTRNIADELPSNLRHRLKGDFAGIKKVRGGGYQSFYGESDDPRPVTEGMIIRNIYKHNHQRGAEDIIESMNDSGALTPDEIGFILDGGMIDPKGDDKETASSIETKLATQFTKPYTFSNKHNAVKASVPN